MGIDLAVVDEPDDFSGSKRPRVEPASFQPRSVPEKVVLLDATVWARLVGALVPSVAVTVTVALPVVSEDFAVSSAVRKL